MHERYIPFSGRNNEYRAEQRNKANLYAPPFACSHRFMITIKHYSLRSGIALALLLCAFFSMRGQVRFSCDAPRQVVAGEQFQVRFVLDGAQGSGFSTSSFDGIEVVFPPANAVSVANVNGHVTTTYTGTFLVREKGKVTIPSASIVANGKRYRTRAILITVMPAESGARGGTNRASARSVADNDLFILAIPSKTTVYEHEALLLSFKLYTHSSRIQFEEAKFPEYDGFIEEEIEQGDTPQLVIEHYKGKNYFTAVIRQVLIYPQRSGALTIPRGDFGLVMAVEDDFDSAESFFAQSAVPTVSKRVASPAVNINVKPLPDGAPEGFTNAVGSNFTIDVSVPDRENLRTGSPSSVILSVRGEGNMKLLAMPKVLFPESFEHYDPTTNSRITAATGGASGVKSDTYQFIPRNTGTFTIPEVTFSYFDPQANAYKTLKSNPIQLNVKQGDNEKAAAFSGNDIAPLSPHYALYTGALYRFTASLLWPGLFVFLILCGFAFYFLFVRYKRLHADTPLNRQKEAAPRALAALKSIQKTSTSASDQRALCEQMANVLYQFVSDRFMIPVSAINKDTLMRLDAPEDARNALLNTLTSIEKIRYGGGASGPNEAHNLSEWIERSIAAIKQMSLKKGGKQ